jgi:hypothetical protein
MPEGERTNGEQVRDGGFSKEVTPVAQGDFVTA